MLSMRATMTGAELDLPAAVRVAESLGVPASLAIALLGPLRAGLMEGMAARSQTTDG